MQRRAKRRFDPRSSVGPGYAEQREVRCTASGRVVLLHAAQEFVRLRQAVREAAGIGAVAAPVG
jgi:hypothetical protein